MAIDAGTLVVNVVPNTAGFNTKLTALMNSVGSKVSKLGPGAAIAAGVAVAGAAAIKAATDFEASFTRIDAISNASAESIAQWRGQVLSLAGETAQSPQELADALYFLASAGLKAGTEMDVLEQAAKGSAIGLGTTSDIAKISAQALNAYAQSGLTATEVTDTLTAAVREGTAEPEEFAVALGRVLPIASRAGVGFDEVTASLASLSNIGLNVNEGTTALRGLLQALVAPSGQAAEALGEIGISADEMREVISEGGLLTALTLLEERTHGNIDQLRKIIPNIRALTGELGLTGENAAKVQEVFDTVLASQGDAAEAFAITAEGPMFKFNQVMAEGQVLLIEFGQALLPIAQNIASVLVPAFSALGGFIGNNASLIRNLVLAFAGFKAISFVPGILKAISLALTSMQVSGLVGIANGLYAIAGGLTAIGATGAGASITNVANNLPLLAGGFAGVGSAVAAFAVAAVGTKVLIDSLSVSVASLSREFGTTAEQSQLAIDAATGLGVRDFIGFLGDPFATSGMKKEEFAGTMASLTAEGQKMGLTFEETDKILLEHGDILNTNRASQEEYSQAVERSFGEQVRSNTKQTLQGILDYSKGITEMSVAGNYVSTVYDKFGTTLLDTTKLTLGQKAAVGGQIQQIYDLGGSLDYAETKWFEQAAAAGDFETITGRLSKDIAKLSEDVGKKVPDALDATKAGISNFASALGTDLETVSSAAFDAFKEDGEAFGENFNDVVGGLEDKWLEAQATFQEGLGGFGDEALGGLLESTTLTTDKVISSFNDARKATQNFGRDLITISKSGGQAGEDLASQLAQAGPQAASFADFVAGASKKARESMINAFGTSEGAAARLATKLQTSIAGALKDIRGLLVDLARGWDIPITANTAGAHASISALEAHLQRVQQTTYTAHLQVVQGGSTNIPGTTPTPGPHPSEFGSYLPGAARGGFVTRPQVIGVAERHRAEMILPLTNSQGEKALAKAMGNAARRFDGGMVRGHDGGTAQLVISGPVKLQVGKTSMDAYISGVARGEDDKQKRYDERIGRMRRD